MLSVLDLAVIQGNKITKLFYFLFISKKVVKIFCVEIDSSFNNLLSSFVIIVNAPI